MISKNVLIGTGVLVVGAAITLFLGRDNKVKDPRLGQPLLPPAQATAFDRVEIKKGAVAATLVRDGNAVWHLDSPTGFPVDAAKVARLVDDLGRSTFKMMASSTDEQKAEFGLDEPETLTLQAAGKEALALRLGNERRGGGRYVAVANEPKAYLVGQSLSVSPDEDQWEMKTLLTVPKATVKSVVFTPAAASGKKPVTLSRDKKEDPLKALGLPKGEKESSQISGVDSSFTGVTFTKRYDPSNEEAKSALSNPSRAVVTLFDGTTYEIAVGSAGDKTKKWFLTVHGAKLSDVVVANIYEVPPYEAQRFDKGLSDFIEAQPKG